MFNKKKNYVKLTPLELRYIEAIETEKIAMLDEKQIYDKIKNCILMHNDILSSHSFPEASTVTLMAQSVKQYLYMLCIGEIELAYQLNVLGIAFEKVTFYNNHSTSYLFDVINKYKDWKPIINKSINQKEIKPLELDAHKTTPKEYFEKLVKIYNDTKELPFTYDWLSVYYHMKDIGIVKETLEWKADLKKRVKHEIIDSIKTKGRWLMMTDENKIDDKILRNEVRKRYVIMKIKEVCNESL